MTNALGVICANLPPQEPSEVLVPAVCRAEWESDIVSGHAGKTVETFNTNRRMKTHFEMRWHTRYLEYNTPQVLKLLERIPLIVRDFPPCPWSMKIPWEFSPSFPLTKNYMKRNLRQPPSPVDGHPGLDGWLPSWWYVWSSKLSGGYCLKTLRTTLIFNTKSLFPYFYHLEYSRLDWRLTFGAILQPTTRGRSSCL